MLATKSDSKKTPSNHNFSSPTTTSNNTPRHPQITAILAKLLPSLQSPQHQDHCRLIYVLAERLANTTQETPALLMALHHFHLAQKAVVGPKNPTDTLDDWTVILCKSGIRVG